jgi:hypothetical protein
MRRSTAQFVRALLVLGMAMCAHPALSQEELVSILPIEDITVVNSEPYQYTTTWTDENGNKYTHDTIINTDGSTVDFHYINGELVGTLYTDVDSNWTFLDKSGTIVYEDQWNAATGTYDVQVGDYATSEDFDALVLQPLQFWNGPSPLYDIMTLESGGGIVYLMSASASGNTSQVALSNVSSVTKGLLTALSKVKASALKAKAKLLALLAWEPRAPHATPVAGEKRNAGGVSAEKRRGSRPPKP